MNKRIILVGLLVALGSAGLPCQASGLGTEDNNGTPTSTGSWDKIGFFMPVITFFMSKLSSPNEVSVSKAEDGDSYAFSIDKNHIHAGPYKFQRNKYPENCSFVLVNSTYSGKWVEVIDPEGTKVGTIILDKKDPIIATFATTSSTNPNQLIYKSLPDNGQKE